MRIKMPVKLIRYGRVRLIVPVCLLLAIAVMGACTSAPAQTVNLPPTQPAGPDDEAEPETVQTEPGDPTAIPECLRDRVGCAVIPSDETIKIGMGGPMTGDYEVFGIDIYEAGLLAIADMGRYLGWDFELVQGDTYQLPFVDNRFDLVTSHRVL